MRRKSYEVRISISCFLRPGWEQRYPHGKWVGAMRVIRTDGWDQAAKLDLAGRYRARSSYGAMRRAIHDLRRFVESGVETIIYVEKK